MLSGRPLALVLLGWSLVKVLAGYLRKRPPGLELFHQNYGADRLAALDSDDREALPQFSPCIACGRCDDGEGERMARSEGAYPGLMQLVLASSRSMPDFDAAARAFERLPEEVLRAKEPVCPTGVPFVKLARFVRTHAAQPLSLRHPVASD